MKDFLEGRAVALYEPIIGRLLLGLRHEVCAMAQELLTGQKKKNTILLDCCCGAGGLLKLAQDFDISDITLFGLDNHEGMLCEAKKNAPEAYLVRGDALHLPFATQSIHVATVCMALHTMPQSESRALMQELLRVAAYVLVADYCLPERNIVVPAAFLAHGIEFLVGGAHYAGYKEFMRGGALEGLLYTQGLQAHARRRVLGGAGQVVLLRSSYAIGC